MSLVIDVKVAPQSGRQKCAIDKSGNLKVFLKSAPEGGKANAELVAFLAKKLSLPQSEIVILLGATSRKKRLCLGVDLDFEQLLNKLGVELQQKIG